MNQDRRQFRRIPLDASVSFQELTFTRDAEAQSSSYLDVSAGGMLISSQKEHALGALLKMEIRVPGWGRYQSSFGAPQELDQRPLVAVGQVVRVEILDDGSYELGIKFLNVYPDDQAALTKFIEASAPIHDQEA